MPDDSDHILDDLLCRWYSWQLNNDDHRLGHSPRSAVVGEFRISRQWDDVNGALDDQIDFDIMVSVDFEISELPDLQRWTIQFLARALALGAAVFMNPRLPQEKADRDELVRKSRIALTERLISAGIM